MARLSRGLVSLAALLLCCADASAQRLFARVDRDLYELDTAPGRLGQIVWATQLPDCGPPPAAGSGRTWSVLHGRYLAWERAGGLCLFDVLAGRVDRFDVPDDAPIVATSDATFAVVLARGPAVHVLGDPRGPIVSLAIPRTHPPQGFVTQPWSYSIAPAGRRLVVVQGADYFPSPPGPALVTTVSLTTGAIERETSAAVPVAWNAVADASGDHVLLLSGDTVSRPGLASGAYLARTNDGVIVASTPGVTPNQGPLVARNDGRRRLLWHQGSGRVIGVDGPAPVPVSVPLLVDLGAYNLPRFAVPPPPQYDPFLSYRLWMDTGSRRLFALENESHQRGNSGGACVRSTLTTIDVLDGQAHTANMQAAVGRLLCGFTDAFFLIGTPDAPAGFTGQVHEGRVTLSWAPTPGVTHYLLEAGTGPRLANLATVVVHGTSFAATGVPPGRYHLRVRAVGVGGEGARTPDLVVTVP